jgi:hypothetical protein
MNTATNDFEVLCEPERAVLKGEFSLSNPMDYEDVFAELKQRIENSDGRYTINLVGAHFMSSSGITALARVVMHAQHSETKLSILVDQSMLWQRKTMVALQHLWEDLEIKDVGS